MNIAPYLVVVRDPGVDPSPRLAAFLERLVTGHGLQLLFEAHHLCVFGQARAPHLLLPDGKGLLWGTLFERATSRRIAEPAQLREPAQAAARSTERYWGGYLMIRLIGAGTEIVRDPSGAIPCYRARVDDAELFTSRVDLLFDAGLLQPDFDWTVTVQSLVYRDLRPARTPLLGVDELMPGSSVTLQEGTAQVGATWSLWRTADGNSEVETHEEAVERVGRSVTNCVTAWGRCFERPLLELSGGLDSSIVAAALARGGCRPLCATFAPVEGDPDETPYARAVAEHLGLELHILRAEVSQVDVTRTHAATLPRPAARAFSQAHDGQLRAIAGRERADAFFSGGGGDNVFAYLRSVLPAIDRARRGNGRVFATLGDVANLTDVSIWKVFASFVRRRLRLRSARRWSRNERFIAGEALRALPFPHGHPWIETPRAVLPGKRVHGQAMIVIQNHLEGFDRLNDAPIISPLISQPVVETCMAVPTWLWCEGGINRAAARKAFAGDLPASVIDRRSKGAFDAWSMQVFSANRPTIRDMLLTGTLARQGLIDVRHIDAALAQESISRPDMLRFLDLADVEAWLLAWSSRTPSGFVS